MYRKAVAAAFMLFAMCSVAAAQTFPSRPITFVTPNAPGAAVDLVSRLVADQLKETLGPVVVENRPGANSSIGIEHAKGAPPDGHTVLVIANSAVISMAMLPNLRWDLFEDFDAVVQTNLLPFFLVINPQALPVKNTRALVEYVKARPGKFSYITPGTGSTHHLAMELFKLQAGLDVVHIPYKSMARGAVDMVAGRAQLTITGFPAVASHVRAEKLVVLATAGSKRSTLLPDVPTIAESGVPDFDVVSWQGLVVPKGTPKPVISRLNEAVNSALRNPGFLKKFADQGVEPMGGSPEDFTQRMRTDLEKWKRVVKTAGIKPD